MKDKFLKDYNKTLDDYYIKRDILEVKQEDLKEQLKAERVTKKIYNEKMNELKKQLANETETAKKDISNSINELRKSYKEHTRVKADNIDDEAIKLLKSGINFTQNELNEMVKKYDGNFTMTRVLTDYAKENDITILAKTQAQGLDNIKRIEETTSDAVDGKYLATVIKDTNHRNDLIKGMLNEL